MADGVMQAMHLADDVLRLTTASLDQLAFQVLQIMSVHPDRADLEQWRERGLALGRVAFPADV